MYIWIGIDVDDQVQNFRQAVSEIEKQFCFANSNLTLPFHISLKISFYVPDIIIDNVILDIAERFRREKPFVLTASNLENCGTIAWIRYAENQPLNRLHDDINEMLQERYGIGLHPYDTDYIFHTTLFMDDDVEKINRAYAQIKDLKLPSKVMVNKFVIGTSPTGKLGSYSVHNTYTVK